MQYAEAVARNLKPIANHTFTFEAGFISLEFTWVMRDKFEHSPDTLTRDDLSAFISFVCMRIFDAELVDIVTDILNSLFASSESLAECFGISDPAEGDNSNTCNSDGECAD